MSSFDGVRDGQPKFRIGHWSVDPDLGEIRRRERRLHLEPRVMDLLVYLASRAGEVVTKDELTRDVWDGAFVGDDALVSAVAALRRSLGDDARRPELVETIPKRGYRLIAPVRRMQVAIAVLPLENLSLDPEEEFLADGMTDALISALGSHPRALQVTSRTSSMRYKNADAPLPEIADALGVDVVVEGSVLRQGELIRISVQLVDARADRQLLARVYERDLGDVLALQSELAYDVDRTVRSALGMEPASEAPPAEVVDAPSFLEYLRGRHHFYRFTRDLLGRSLERFERARDLDPDSPYPHLGIVNVWGWRAAWGLAPAREARREIARSIARVIELGADLAEVQTMVGKVTMNMEWDWQGAERAFRRALEINPHEATALWSYGLLTLVRGRLDEGMALARRAMARDPLDPSPETVLGMALLLAGETGEALERLRHAYELTPIPPTRLAVWNGLVRLERWDEAREAAADYLTLLDRADVAERLKPGGGRDHYRAVMSDAAAALAAARERGYVQSTQIARLHLHAGEAGRALEWLEIAYADRDPSLVYLVLPEWEPLRSDAGFRDLVEQVGLVV